MKNFILMFSLLMSSVVFASESKIYEINYNEARAENEFYFVANTDEPELKRAWVKLVFNDFNNEWPAIEVEVKVAGLSYDPEDRVILYENGDNKVVCANVSVRGRSIFRRTIVSPTGNCEFTTQVEERFIDYGMRRFKKSFLIISLSI